VSTVAGTLGPNIHNAEEEEEEEKKRRRGGGLRRAR
jgi:hypothetical protein